MLRVRVNCSRQVDAWESDRGIQQIRGIPRVLGSVGNIPDCGALGPARADPGRLQRVRRADHVATLREATGREDFCVQIPLACSASRRVAHQRTSSKLMPQGAVAEDIGSSTKYWSPFRSTGWLLLSGWRNPAFTQKSMRSECLRLFILLLSHILSKQ